ncbi:putative quinol monooxygenase [Geoalkalibacter subterraneus]|uniref:putative quinol monooxygenase n=1 Tax=Geoalkalibacter subterraneus TaxID=483547 RepID=UPI000694CF33|nr:antibiotic biosynthesis monooxygenase family protein [Geoalkalibacter subterraneus]
MIDATIKMTVPADKRIEVLQTIKSLLGPIRKEQGCLSCYCCLDSELEHIIILRQEWNTDKDLTAYLKSGHFNILLGAMKLLLVEPEVRFNTIASTAGKEVITAVRSPNAARGTADKETIKVMK